MTEQILIEVCVDSAESAMAAERGGAHRVELCSSLLDGGITPSSGLIALVRQLLSIQLHVMIRPRAGDFNYSEEEFQIMQRDILACKKLGADGVVLGLLDLDGKIDKARTRELVELAVPMRVTYHRAFDMSVDLFQALQDIQSTGVHCVLTSGGEQTAMEGAATLKQLVRSANGNLAIMAGGGIEESNVAALIAQTGVREIHASLKFPVASSMRYQNHKVSMGTVEGREYERYVVREDKVQRLLRAAMNGSTLNQDSKVV